MHYYLVMQYPLSHPVFSTPQRGLMKGKVQGLPGVVSVLARVVQGKLRLNMSGCDTKWNTSLLFHTCTCSRASLSSMLIDMFLISSSSSPLKYFLHTVTEGKRMDPSSTLVEEVIVFPARYLQLAE